MRPPVRWTRPGRNRELPPAPVAYLLWFRNRPFSSDGVDPPTDRDRIKPDRHHGGGSEGVAFGGRAYFGDRPGKAELSGLGKGGVGWGWGGVGWGGVGRAWMPPVLQGDFLTFLSLALLSVVC